MATVIPRWEWRTFDSGLGKPEAALLAKKSAPDQESDETYFLSKTGGENVKVRDGLMDIKVLREVDAAGLEQWVPMMKAAFPLPAAEATKVFEALRSPPPATMRATYTLPEFEAALASLPTPVRAVHVHKLRRRCKMGESSAEVSDVTAGGHTRRTIAVEGEDAAAVIAAVRGLGLADWLNTSFPKGLAALVDGAPARYAVLDCGTNSVKFHVAERAEGGGWRTVTDRAELTRLGEGLKPGGKIASQALERTIEAINGMVREGKALGVRAIAAVGTAGLRMAMNSADVLATIRTRTGMSIAVITGEEESRLAYVGVQSGLDLGQGSLVVFDTGGGSSQFTFGRGSTVDERFSLDVGAVMFTDSFGLAGVVTPQILARALAAIDAAFARVGSRPRPDRLVGMGGAVTNLAAVKHGMTVYDPNVIQGSTLDKAEIERQIELYRSRDADARRSITGLQPKRADVILAGACIVKTIMETLGHDTLTVSDRGLRHGVLAERFGTGGGAGPSAAAQ